MRVEEISYSIAAPAKNIDIIKYLLTGGRYGKLFIREDVKRMKYWAELDSRTNLNSRCHPVPLMSKNK